MLRRPFPTPLTYPRFEMDYLDTIRVDECGFCQGSGKYWGSSIDPSDRGEWCTCDRCGGTGEIHTNVTDTEEALS
jgi:DnaJ-class molecular chaperone